MGSTAKTIRCAVAAALAAPAMLLAAGSASAANLTVSAEPQITTDGIWIRWTGGSGPATCTTVSNWTEVTSYQDALGRGGAMFNSPPRWQFSEYHITCDNGDTGVVGAAY